LQNFIGCHATLSLRIRRRSRFDRMSPCSLNSRPTSSS
jgi:hypothetical protein